MVYKVFLVYGAFDSVVERQVVEVENISVNDCMTFFYDKNNHVLAAFANENILYYERISLG